MSIWDHLFLSGEFRAREDLLCGLTLGKIVALRQRIGVWPPKAATEES